LNRKLNNKVALITGSASGIGYAEAKLFLEEGAIVAICDIDEVKVKKAVAELSVLGIVRGFKVDISQKEQDEKMVSELLTEFQRIDILVNNAGITKDAQFYKMTDAQFKAVIDVNLMGNYYMTKAVVPVMMENKYGKIVHTSSVSAYNGNFGQTNYAASKAAIMGMTRVQAKELGKYCINVNAVCPGSILTDMYAAVPEEVKQKKLSTIPLRRYGAPSECAQLVCFLASDEASYVTAQCITIDGGFN